MLTSKNSLLIAFVILIFRFHLEVVEPDGGGGADGGRERQGGDQSQSGQSYDERHHFGEESRGGSGYRRARQVSRGDLPPGSHHHHCPMGTRNGYLFHFYFIHSLIH